jgi:hypothetical protein
VKTHGTEADGTLARCRVARGRHAVRSALDEVLQHVVEQPQDVFDESRVGAPFVPALEVHRGEAADGRARPAVLITTRRQQDLAAKVRLPDAQPRRALVRGEFAVRRIDEQQIRLPRLQSCLEQPLPQQPRRDLA